MLRHAREAVLAGSSAGGIGTGQHMGNFLHVCKNVPDVRFVVDSGMPISASFDFGSEAHDFLMYVIKPGHIPAHVLGVHPMLNSTEDVANWVNDLVRWHWLEPGEADPYLRAPGLTVKQRLVAIARLYAGTALNVNCCCPGYCRTDMASNRGPRPPEVGARNAVMLAEASCKLNGEFIQDERVSEW